MPNFFAQQAGLEGPSPPTGQIQPPVGHSRYYLATWRGAGGRLDPVKPCKGKQLDLGLWRGKAAGQTPTQPHRGKGACLSHGGHGQDPTWSYRGKGAWSGPDPEAGGMWPGPVGEGGTWPGSDWLCRDWGLGTWQERRWLY